MTKTPITYNVTAFPTFPSLKVQIKP